MLWRRIAAVAVLATGLGACATADTVRDAPPEAGVVQNFDAPYDRVTAATLNTLRQLNLSITNTDERPTGLHIQVSKAMNLFSWGEVGRIIVERPTAPPTPVRVYWEKRSQMQITGTSQRAFAAELYKGIGEQLGQR